jgi:hypothetical protein
MRWRRSGQRHDGGVRARAAPRESTCQARRHGWARVAQLFCRANGACAGSPSCRWPRSKQWRPRRGIDLRHMPPCTDRPRARPKAPNDERHFLITQLAASHMVASYLGSSRSGCYESAHMQGEHDQGRTDPSGAAEHDHAGSQIAVTDEACNAVLDAKLERRCHLPRGHDGLHCWRSDDRAKAFQWG